MCLEKNFTLAVCIHERPGLSSGLPFLIISPFVQRLDVRCRIHIDG